MSLTNLFVIFVVIFILMAPVIAVFLSTPTRIGSLGERLVNRQLKRLEPNQYRIMSDLYLPSANGQTAQIDHLVVSPFGLFVIETKNYRGWIFGDENATYWTQVIFKNKEKMFNPIIQNKGHIKALKSLLGEENNIIYIPIVVFVRDAALHLTVSSYVIHLKNLVPLIRSHTRVYLKNAEVEHIVMQLEAAGQPAKEARAQHIERLRKDADTRRAKIRANICPVCGGQLVARNGRYGAFTGCSNYPKCRFTA